MQNRCFGPNKLNQTSVIGWSFYAAYDMAAYMLIFSRNCFNS